MILHIQFWSVDGDDTSIEKTFDYGELEAVNIHDHVVQQRVSEKKLLM